MMNRFTVSATILIVATMITAGCSRKKGATGPGVGGFIPSVGKGGLAACAYDGMHMKVSAMEAHLDYDGETLYFCSEDEKARYQQYPGRYRNTFRAGEFNGVFGALTRDEYRQVLSKMGMSPKGGEGSRLFVVLHDKNGDPVPEAVVSVSINGREIPLEHDESMRVYGADALLSAGATTAVTVKVSRGGETASSNPITYAPG